MKDIIIIGSGGHAKVVIDIIHEMNNYNIIGIASNTQNIGDSFYGYEIIGNDDKLPFYKDRGINYVAMGIGGYKDNNLRKDVFNKIKCLSMSFINVIHPLSTISKSVILGEGVTIFPGVVLNTEVKIGNNVIIATGSTIDHETVVHNHVLISAGVTIGAYSIIEEEVLIALGSKIISGVKIGGGSLVASGAVVVNNITEGSKVFGIPAKNKNF